MAQSSWNNFCLKKWIFDYGFVVGFLFWFGFLQCHFKRKVFHIPCQLYKILRVPLCPLAPSPVLVLVSYPHLLVTQQCNCSFSDPGYNKLLWPPGCQCWPDVHVQGHQPNPETLDSGNHSRNLVRLFTGNEIENSCEQSANRAPWQIVLCTVDSLKLCLAQWSELLPVSVSDCCSNKLPQTLVS